MSIELIADEGKTKATLTVLPANIMIGLARNNKQNEAKEEKDAERWFARYWIYAACVACSKGEITQGEVVTPISELSFDAYYALSDGITLPWLNEVFNVNPHWVPDSPPSEDEKKKA
jgi:hypothetical protein